MIAIKKTFKDKRFAIRVYDGSGNIAQYFSTRLKNLEIKNDKILIKSKLHGHRFTVVTPDFKKTLIDSTLPEKVSNKTERDMNEQTQN